MIKRLLENPFQMTPDHPVDPVKNPDLKLSN
jgi:hypothetical protein